MSENTVREEAALEEEARRRGEEIRATEEAAALAADDESMIAPDSEIAQTRRSDRQGVTPAALSGRVTAARNRRGRPR